MFRLLSAVAASSSRHILRRTRLVNVSRDVRPPITVSTTCLRWIQTDSSSSLSRTCPECGSPLPTALPVCPSCLYISDIPKTMTYHEMLGVPYGPNPFMVNPSELKKTFRQVQSVVHPDRWVGKTKDQQEAAALMSTKINAALHHLTDPLRRVEYILSTVGLRTEEQDGIMDKEFLSEVMEMLEGVENAESQEMVEVLRAENQEKLQQTIKDIETLVGQKDWPAVQAAAVRLKYLQSIEKAAAAWPARAHDH